MTKRYKDTVFLPQTHFSMKGNLPEKEPLYLKAWGQADLYGEALKTSQGQERRVVHVGPPYANGHLHMGHALSHILKDITARYYRKQGYDSPLVPGWDCHGLPIEWKVEEEFRAAGRAKESISTWEFRARCRTFAEQWIQVQAQEFQRLGILADWNNPYTTFAYSSQAAILKALGHFLNDGTLYRGVKPVMWSPVEKTALAEAEIEYKDRVSLAIDVAFPVQVASTSDLQGASVVIWTTTPWSLPGNRAIAYNPDIAYALVEVPNGKRYLIAESLVDVCSQRWEQPLRQLKRFAAADLKGTVCTHPWYGRGYDFNVPLLPGDHVTAEDGTGFVHTAPEHGVEDFGVAQENGIPIPSTVDEAGLYYDHVPLWAGQSVFKSPAPIVESLKELGVLLACKEIKHSYPHSWRSKGPLIYRTTPQWFIALDRTGLRQKALNALDQVNFVPDQGKNRLKSMIEKRPDWCISRQRVWGVPLAIFVHKVTGEPLRDAKVHERIVQEVEQRGCDFWFEEDVMRFLEGVPDASHYTPVFDILDVWFDSGSSHQYVCQNRGLGYPAEVYLEGSDQHRGWFQSSLLVGAGLTGKAPYRNLVTHGFLLDQTGHKLSKSQGNGLSLDEVLRDYGADIIRLWVVGSDYTNDITFGRDVLKRQEDIYRRIRNTLRYLLGVLPASTDHVGTFQTLEEVQKLPLLEQWVLHRLKSLQKYIQEISLQNFDYNHIIREIHQFCNEDLSAFYFDIRKDTLYCDSKNHPTRRAALKVMAHVFDCLVHGLAPILCFTTEEAWHQRYGTETSVHTQPWPDLPDVWHQKEASIAIMYMRMARGGSGSPDSFFGAGISNMVEKARQEGLVGSSLQVKIKAILSVEEAEILALLQRLSQEEMLDILGISACDFHLSRSTNGMVSLSASDLQRLPEEWKCQRCWKYREEAQGPDQLCARCADVVDEMKKAGEIVEDENRIYVRASCV